MRGSPDDGPEADPHLSLGRNAHPRPSNIRTSESAQVSGTELPGATEASGLGRRVARRACPPACAPAGAPRARDRCTSRPIRRGGPDRSSGALIETDVLRPTARVTARWPSGRSIEGGEPPRAGGRSSCPRTRPRRSTEDRHKSPRACHLLDTTRIHHADAIRVASASSWSCVT